MKTIYLELTKNDLKDLEKDYVLEYNFSGLKMIVNKKKEAEN